MEVPFIQEVSSVYTSPILDTDDLKMALRARKLSGAFEKRAPGAQTRTARSGDERIDHCTSNKHFTINEEIHARSLANFYRQYADRHMNLKFM